MDREIINKLDEITSIIRNDKDLKRMKELEKIIMSNNSLLSDIELLKNMNQYDKSYLDLKKKILANKEFKEYKKLERELYLFLHDINKILNSFSEKSDCR